MSSAMIADMDITPELAEKVLRGGTDAIAVVRGIYQTQIQKLDAIETQAQQMLEAAEMLPLRWIPVSERLPEMGVYVAALWPRGPETSNLGERVRVVKRGVPEWYLQTGVEMTAPSHWMPLPEPPECP